MTPPAEEKSVLAETTSNQSSWTCRDCSTATADSDDAAVLTRARQHLDAHPGHTLDYEKRWSGTLGFGQPSYDASREAL